MSRKKQTNQKITALYCRISLDDGGDNESMSISNQKLLLKDHAEKLGMFQYEYYVDDGYTGRNFNRPSFRRMIADIEAGKVGCVITKDLSRLGRNYIEAGIYIEIFFPKHNVRYIAVTDGVDSLTSPELDITPFKNILNDMYSRDISKKVLAGRMTRSRQGKFCGGQPPLGLMRDPEDKGHLIRDPETAPVIRKIYDMALDGWGCMRIAKQLMDDKVPITRVKSNTECDVNYYSWGSARISHILRNPFYKGAHLVCRTHQKGIRSNTYDIIPRDQWEVIEGCHEAIVTPEEWEQAQSVWAQGAVPVLVDPKGACIARAKPEVVVDAILAKRNLGTCRNMAPLTIALGPGFVAGQDVDAVVETKRGHRLGRIIREGSAIPNTGIPGIIGGYGAERVIHAQAAGVFMNVRKIGDFVEKGETIATIRTPEGAEIPVTAQIPGILRGLLRSGYPVTPGFKIADIDPRREELSNCFLISDKSRCIAGSVLELVCAQVWQ